MSSVARPVFCSSTKSPADDATSEITTPVPRRGAGAVAFGPPRVDGAMM
jgi:hypothetical protein